MECNKMLLAKSAQKQIRIKETQRVISVQWRFKDLYDLRSYEAET